MSALAVPPSRVFESARIGVRLRLPADWSVERDEPGGLILAGPVPEGARPGDEPPRLRVQRLRLVGDTAQTFAELERSLDVASAPGVTVLRREERTIAGHRALVVLATRPSPSAPAPSRITLHQTSVPVGADLLSLTAVAGDPAPADLIATLDAAAASLEIFQPAG